jgi:hypothetical protein
MSNDSVTGESIATQRLGELLLPQRVVCVITGKGQLFDYVFSSRRYEKNYLKRATGRL